MATAATARPISNIAVAFAQHSASNKAPIQRDAFEAPGAGPDHRAMLLTPPNSISPTLPAHKHRSDIRVREVPPLHLQPDSDIDLQDAVEHAAAQDLPSSALSREALAGVEAAGQITPAMLAKHHLPGIFMGSSPMPVRDIMHHLTLSVPGYSFIPPAKARRLVVAALEHRAGGGLHGEVKFEKVGWGRWHVKPQSGNGVPIGAQAARSGMTPPASVDSAGGLMIPRLRAERDMYVGSWAAGSTESRDEEMADNMSLDGSEDSSDSDGSDMDLDGIDDQTDEEDWSAIGPDTLRSESRRTRHHDVDYNFLSRTSGVRFRTPTSQSAPFSRPHLAGRATTTPASHGHGHSTFASRFNTGTPAFASSIGVLDTKSERDAVAALIAMGSM